MTIETDLLPLPKGEAVGMYQAWSYDQMRDYARANVLHHTEGRFRLRWTRCERHRRMTDYWRPTFVSIRNRLENLKENLC